MHLIAQLKSCTCMLNIRVKDAHKHLGTDKGLSTVIGTPGTLSFLQGHVQVGTQPAREELVRGIANMLLVGVRGYCDLYHNLAENVSQAVHTIESSGMTVVHGKNRTRGSTVFLHCFCLKHFVTCTPLCAYSEMQL